jgi:centriolar protein POC1
MELPQYSPIGTMRAHTDNVDHVKIAHNVGTQCISVAHDNTFKFWDFSNSTMLKSVDAHTDSVYGLDISRNGQFFATCGADFAVAIWDYNT